MTIWTEEIDSTYGGAWRVQLSMDRVLFEGQSAFQDIVVFENRLFGRVLVLDGVVQTTERDEFFYHEMAVHVPMLAHGDVRRALIVGGGDGGALEEMLKHSSIDRVTMVEIDDQVVEVAKAHLKPICGAAFEDPRMRLVIADGVEYLKDCSDRFDLILVDSTDPLGFDGGDPAGPGAVLFSESFYASCKRRMNPGAVLVTQNAVPFFEEAGLRQPVRNLGAVFSDVACFRVAVPSFYGGDMVFSWGSDEPKLRRLSLDQLGKRHAAAGFETRYYTPGIHLGAFALPAYLKEIAGPGVD